MDATQIMTKEIVKEQLSPETKDSMGNPVGQSHKPIQVRGGGSKSFPSFTTEGKNKLKTMLLSEGKKKEKIGIK